MNEILFLVEEMPDGGFIAMRLGFPLLPRPMTLRAFTFRSGMQCIVISVRKKFLGSFIYFSFVKK